LKYLRAVARRKERALRESRARARREEKDRLERQRRKEEEQDRARNPEEYIQHDLEEWVKWEGIPFTSLEKSAQSTLVETMGRMREKFGAAFPSMAQELKNRLIHLVEEKKPQACLERIQVKFMDILSGRTVNLHQKPLANPVKDRPLSHFPNDRVRQVLDAFLRPQDRATYVPP